MKKTNIIQWIKNLFNKEKQRSYGLVPQPTDSRDYHYKASSEPLPVSASAYEDNEEVTYQNGWNSCVAHSAAKLLTDEVHNIVPAYLKDWKAFKCSEAYLWYTTRLQEGTETQNTGVVARNAFKSIKKLGFVSRDQWDYKDGPYTKPPQAVIDLAGVHLFLMDYFPDYVAISTILANRMDLIRDAIAHGHKVSLAIPVYTNFNKYTGGVLTSFTGSMLGYHDVVIGEYETQEDGTIVFRGLNSWGTRWGEHGYFRITEELLKANAFDIWTFQDPETT